MAAGEVPDGKEGLDQNGSCVKERKELIFEPSAKNKTKQNTRDCIW